VRVDEEFIPRLVEAPARGGRILGRSELTQLTAPEPLIGNVLDRGTLAILYGPWGVGKSFVAIDWAASVATGRPWQGRPTKQSGVLYIAAEGVQGFDKRLSAWEQAWRYTIPDDQFNIHPGAVNLMDHIEVGEMVDRIRHTDYGLIVVDTLARCTTGADENTARDMGIAISSLDRLREASGGGTVLVVHTPARTV
jgi:RecA-family ATPase